MKKIHMDEKKFEDMTRDEQIKYYRDNLDEFYNTYEDALVRYMAPRIDPDKAGMTREEALALRAAFKHCGLSREDFADIMRKSAYDQGTFYSTKEWNRTNQNTPKSGREAGAGTIKAMFKRSGEKFPDPKIIIEEEGGSSLPKPLKVTSAARQMSEGRAAAIKVKCYFDTEAFSSKPDPVADAPRIQKRRPSGVCEDEYTLDEIRKKLLNGQTLVATQCKGYETESGSQSYKYISQQLIIIDVDNEYTNKNHEKVVVDDPLTISEAFKRCKSAGVVPFFTYKTFSCKKAEESEKPHQKFRLCFLLDEPIHPEEYGDFGRDKILRYFFSIIGDDKHVDYKVTDPGRLIYGTNNTEDDSYRSFDWTVSKSEIIKRVFPDHIEETSEEPEEAAEESQEHESDVYKPLSMDDLEEWLNERDKYTGAIKTGIFGVDRALHGGLINTLYTMSGQTGTGKSALMLNFAENIAGNNSNIKVFYYAFEMGKGEIQARGASRFSKKYEGEHFEDAAGNSKKVSAIPYADMLGEKVEKINGQITFTWLKSSVFADYARRYVQNCNNNFIFRECGLDDKMNYNKLCEEVIEYKENNPDDKVVVFVDYLQIIAPSENGETPQDLARKASKALKALSTQIGCTVFMVSSMTKEDARNNKGDEYNMKDAVDTAYNSDCVIYLKWDRDTDEEAAEEAGYKKEYVLKFCNNRGWRSMCFEILKARSMAKGETAKLKYYAAFDYYEDAIVEKPVRILSENDYIEDDGIDRQTGHEKDQENDRKMRAALLTILTKNEEDADKTKYSAGELLEAIAENLNIQTGRDSTKYKKMEKDAKRVLYNYGTFSGAEFRLTCDKKSCIDTLEKEMKAHEEFLT